MRKATKSLLIAAVAAFGLSACTDDVTVVEPQPPEPPPPEDATLTIQSVEDFQGNNVDPDNVSGQVVVVYNVEAGDQDVSEIQLVIDGEARTCQTVSGGGAAASVAGSQSQQSADVVECVLNTTALEGFEQCVGQQAQPEFANGQHTIGGNLVLEDGTSVNATNSVTLNFQNQNTLIVERTAGPEAVGNGRRYFGGGTVSFAACPVVFDTTFQGQIAQVGLAGNSAGGTASVTGSGPDVDLGGGHGALAVASDTFTFDATVANNADEVEDDPALTGHTVGGAARFSVTTAEGENVTSEFVSDSINLFLDFTGPVVTGTPTIEIGGMAVGSSQNFFACGEFGISSGLIDRGVGLGPSPGDFLVTDAAGDTVTVGAPGDTVAGGDTLTTVEDVTQLPEADTTEYTVELEDGEVDDRLGNATDVSGTVTPEGTFGVDITAPVITSPAPSDTALIVNDSVFTFTAADTAGADDFAGLDPTMFEAFTADGDTLAVTDAGDADPNTFAVRVDTLANGNAVPEGPIQIELTVADLALCADGPNVFTAVTFDALLDRTPPDVSFSGVTGLDESNASSVELTVDGTVLDRGALPDAVTEATMFVTLAGTNTTCDSPDPASGSDDVYAPASVEVTPDETSGDGVVDLDLLADVQSDSTGDFSATFTAQNLGGTANQVKYCFWVVADDGAVDRTGADDGVAGMAFASKIFTWNP